MPDVQSNCLAGRQGNAGMRPEHRARAGVEGGPKHRLLFQLKSDFFLPPLPTPNSEEAKIRGKSALVDAYVSPTRIYFLTAHALQLERQRDGLFSRRDTRFLTCNSRTRPWPPIARPPAPLFSRSGKGARETEAGANSIFSMASTDAVERWKPGTIPSVLRPGLRSEE